MEPMGRLQATEEEMERILALMRDPNWAYLKSYIERIHASATAKLKRLSNTEKTTGYWIGVTTLLDDILISWPEAFAAELETKNHSTEKGESKDEVYMELE